MPESVLEVLRELERADGEIAAALAELEGLAREVDGIRSQADELEAFAALLPAERERRAAEMERARAEVPAAKRALVEAEESLRTAKPDAAREPELFAVRARDRLSVAERRAAQADAAAADLEHQAGEAARRGHELHARGTKIAGELGDRPRLAGDAGKAPGPQLEEIQAWSETARAALFVARGQLAAERDGVIRQANELGVVALGEPLTALGTEALARRVEQGLADKD